MISIPAYFDGNAVRPLDNYSFEKNQKLFILVQDDSEKESEAKKDIDFSFVDNMFGILSDEETEEMRKHCHLKFKEIEV